MALSVQTRSGDLAETFKSERESVKNQIRVALPGVVHSFNPQAVTAVVQPAIRYVVEDNDGRRSTQKALQEMGWGKVGDRYRCAASVASIRGAFKASIAD